MHVKRPSSSFAILVVCCAGAAAALVGTLTRPANGKTPAAPATGSPTIGVTAGKPTELAFRLSSTSPLPAGAIAFKVTNRGKLAHTFKVCTRAAAKSTANACTGKATRLLKPGQSETLTVTLAKEGTYQYLSTVAGQAAGGMKGQIEVAPTVVVTAGEPSELQFKLSKSSLLPAGPIAFRVTNKGKLDHSFKICTRASATAAANACTGKATRALKPGQSAALVVTLATKGVYEYLSTVGGQAVGGMKGQIGVETTPAPPVAAPPQPAPTTTEPAPAPAPAPAPPSAKPPATEPLVGDPAAGAAVFASAGCGSCHALAAAGASGTVGPSLDGLAHQLTQALITHQVTNGGQTMPAFGNSLSPTQINDVAAYVYKSTHA